MNWLINALTKLGFLNEDLDYPVIRASMVIVFLFFGYQKWFEYEAQVLIPYISNGPLIWWIVSRVRRPQRELVLGRRRMDVRCAPIRRLLGQAAEHSWRRRFGRD